MRFHGELGNVTMSTAGAQRIISTGNSTISEPIIKALKFEIGMLLFTASRIQILVKYPFLN